MTQDTTPLTPPPAAPPPSSTSSGFCRVRKELLSTHVTGKKHLPQPRGHYSVGYVDVMTPGDPREGTFVRIYYPTDEKWDDQHQKWPHWTFEEKYIAGIHGFLQAMGGKWPPWAPKEEYLFFNEVRRVMGLLPQFGAVFGFKYLVGNVHTPILEDASLKKTPAAGGDKKWPLVVFSHGIGCSRFIYSNICYDMASFGFIVAAVEHREGSACMSRYYEAVEGSERPLNDPEHIRWLPHFWCKEGEDEYTLRNRQVHFRSDEVIRALDLMVGLNEGRDVGNIFLKSPCNRNYNAADSKVAKDSVLAHFKDAVDLSKVVVSGHSFGGATTLLTLARDKRFKAGVALDSWLFPLKDEDISAEVTQPIIFINSESFLHRQNLEKMATFKVDGGGSEGVPKRQCCYIKGSVHQNHLDIPFVLKCHLVRRIFGTYSDTCPEIVMVMNSVMIVKFMWEALGIDGNPTLEEVVEANQHLLVEGFDIPEGIPKD